MSAFVSVEKLLHNHEYTIKISNYDINGFCNCDDVKTFKGRYIGWKLNGLQHMFIPDCISGVCLFSALTKDVTKEASAVIREALKQNVIGLETICLVFDNIHVVSAFDPKTQRFAQQLDQIKPFKVLKTETRCGTVMYETYVNLNYISGAGSNTDMDHYVEVKLIE